MQPLFSDAGEQALVEVMKRKPLLAFDFDGTLAPIVSRPEQARMPQAWARALAELATLRPVAIVTGRAVADVTSRLSFKPTYVIGNHGAEDPTGVMPTGSIQRLDAVRRSLLQHAERWTALGIEVEDKRFSLALHYRLADDQVAAARCVEELMQGLEEGLHLFRGKCVMNVAPDDAPDKGDAVVSLVGRAQAGAAFFAGDDANDEPVFERAPAEWFTLKIGRDGVPSRARFFVDAHEEMGRLLQRLLALAREGAQSW
jgi:trehalose 6-phosphate phosphatase